jgi:hypothetical protein
MMCSKKRTGIPIIPTVADAPIYVTLMGSDFRRGERVPGPGTLTDGKANIVELQDGFAANDRFMGFGRF